MRERQVRLSERPCMVITPQPELGINDYYNTPILDPEDLVTNLSCDVNQLHEIHGLYALHVGNVTTPTPSWLSKLSLNSISAGLIEGSGYPASETQWTMCATQPAYTRLHYDAGKYATHITSTHGAKLWIVADELPSEGLADFKPDKSEIGYVYFILERGSMLSMPPRWPHAILSLTDTFVQGGHVFNNKQGTDLVRDPSKDYVEHEEQACHTTTYTTLMRDNPLPPDIENMASLLAMTVHVFAFEPQSQKGKPIECPISIYTQHPISSLCVRLLLHWVPDLHEAMCTREKDIYDSLKGSKSCMLKIFKPLVYHI
ncbi:hypothetical protein M422DRAFT_50206 [Sphaerobolus stellatus SS14]|uniref:Unplaced genomic scaffold SPHSTscaffold_90, whole genome shotgun sequence n=1 Tax=Sphaerobolus stellatus (strain SS14) TaxID=990650 RepID=A0A0C9VJP1_SPHS4|nr:hypothetical protein M422DRAFT_50206 [Sphaerobolus stellatus SS14]